MKRKKRTVESMNIIDLAITETGSAEGLVDFLKTNPNLDVNGVIQGGTEFISDSDQVRNSKMVDYFGSLKVRVNTGDLGVPEPPYLSAAGGFIGQVELSWTGGNASSKHEVWRRKKGGTEFFKVATVDAGVSVHTDTGLEHGATYEYKVRVAEVGSQDFSNVVEGSTLAPDLVVRADSPENVGIAGTGTVVHEGGFSYLFATSGKAAVTALYLCDAQVQGVVDLSSADWTGLSYVCVNNATNLDLRLGDWVNRDSVQIKVVNSFVFKEALKPFIAHVREVNGTASNTGRVLDIGVITLDLDSQSDAQLMDDIDFLTNNGWDVKIVYGKLLSFKVQTRTFVDLRGRVAENAGEELWMKSGEVFESGYVANTETVELYHSDIENVATIDLDDVGLSFLDESDLIHDYPIKIYLRGSDSIIQSVAERIVDEEVTDSQLVLDFLSISNVVDNALTLLTEACFDASGVEIIHAKHAFAYHWFKSWAVTPDFGGFLKGFGLSNGDGQYSEYTQFAVLLSDQGVGPLYEQFGNKEVCSSRVAKDMSAITEVQVRNGAAAKVGTKFYLYAQKLSLVDEIVSSMTLDGLNAPREVKYEGAFKQIQTYSPRVCNYQDTDSELTIDFSELEEVDEFNPSVFGTDRGGSLLRLLPPVRLRSVGIVYGIKINEFWFAPQFDASSLEEFRTGGVFVRDANYSLNFNGLPNLRVLDMGGLQVPNLHLSNLPVLQELLLPDYTYHYSTAVDKWGSLQAVATSVDWGTVPLDQLKKLRLSGDLGLTSIDLSGSQVEEFTDVCTSIVSYVFPAGSLKSLVLKHHTAGSFKTGVATTWLANLNTMFSDPSWDHPLENYTASVFDAALSNDFKQHSLTVLEYAFRNHPDKDIIKSYTHSFPETPGWITLSEFAAARVFMERDWIRTNIRISNAELATVITDVGIYDCQMLMADVVIVDHYSYKPNSQRYGVYDSQTFQRIEFTNNIGPWTNRNRPV